MSQGYDSTQQNRHAIETILARLNNVQELTLDRSWQADCPACGQPGMVMKRSYGKLTYSCPNSCRQDSIAAQLGVGLHDIIAFAVRSGANRSTDVWDPDDDEDPGSGEHAHSDSAQTAHSSPPPSWPEIEDAAYYGLAGDIVRAISPHSEADPAALLTGFLAAFGCIVGRNRYFQVEADRHYPNIFVGHVGATSKGRKGTSWGQTKRLFESVDGDWLEKRVWSGLSSGEGLIYQVRDATEKREPIREKGKGIVGYQRVVDDEGEEDKRLLVQEPELAGALRVIEREGNKLSALIRQAWDSGSLRSMTKSPQKASNTHIAIVGHITSDELRRYLSRTEVANGFANRFLWICVRRSKELPEGGLLHTVDFGSILTRLKSAVSFAQEEGQIRRDNDARAMWNAVYHDLSASQPGLAGAIVGRSEAQVVRLSLLYALLDCSPVVRGDHMHAALAVWEYAAASATFIFGDSLGDPVADDTLRAIRAAHDGITRDEIRNLFGRHKSSDEIARVLGILETAGLVRKDYRDTAGRRAEVWFAT